MCSQNTVQCILKATVILYWAFSESYDTPNGMKNLKENSMYALIENTLTIMIDTSSTSLGFPFKLLI